jgi:hypothetical protein
MPMLYLAAAQQVSGFVVLALDLLSVYPVTHAHAGHPFTHPGKR